ncbi:MAG: sugar fermentation stimulation protein A [Rhodospirillaceae bacterium]|nr:MAG: sugar fermentation stimulation protein A [Rhodospirillaceae bacterium]
MRFSTPLIRGTLLRRYKRFLADVTLDDGQEVTAHCANSGSMLGCQETGAEVWLTPAAAPKRRLPYTWEMIRIGDTLVGINTARPNTLVAEAIAMDHIPELTGYESIRREVNYGTHSRIDMLLKGTGRAPCYVEVKNVTLKRDGKRDGTAEFPDAVTERGTKHLRELTAVVAGGERAVLVFLVQRNDCQRFRVAADIDPVYNAAFFTALSKGVEVLCYSCTLDLENITVARALPVEGPLTTPNRCR